MARKTNGGTVRAIREALGIRQGAFARDVLISAGYLSNIEAGRKQPPPDVVKRIADRLGVFVDDITYPVPEPAAAAPATAVTA